MPSTISLISKLQADFPQFHFTPGDNFRWSPVDTTIYYPDHSGDNASLLHELSHAILGHKQYIRDIQLITFEQEAWRHAKESLAPNYSVHISDEQIDSSLDTYRDWLHARSTCPACQATGMQTKRQRYSCVACQTTWQVNDARICNLRRTVIT